MVVFTDRKAIIIALSTAIDAEEYFLYCIGEGDPATSERSKRLIAAWRRILLKFTGSKVTVKEMMHEKALEGSVAVSISEIRDMAESGKITPPASR